MCKIIVVVLLFLTCLNNYGQEFKKVKSRFKHTDEIIAIATTNDFFATCSFDKSVIVWNYEGRVVYKYQIAEGKINSLSFIQDSNSLLVGITEKKNSQERRHIIRCLDITGNPKYELIDTTLIQTYVDEYYWKNTKGMQSAIGSVSNTFPGLNINKEIGVPQVKSGLSHIEIV